MKIAQLVLKSLCIVTLFNTATASDLTLDDLFPTDRVLDVQITVAQEDWNTIRYQRREFQEALAPERQFQPIDSPYTYVKAKVTIDGVEFPQVGIRKKGFIGSQDSIRPSLKIKLNYVDKTAGIGGLTNLTLNNNRQDTTQMSQFMGYALFNAAGSPACRCAYAKVTVNGSNHGVYTHVETARKPLLKRGFGNDTGTLYEGTVVDFFADWEGSFENKVGDDEPGREKIRQLIAALQGGAGDTILDQAVARAIVPTDDTFDDTWTALDFDDSDWKSGSNGVGYETQTGYETHIGERFNFVDEMHNKTTSVYVRIPFEISDVEKIRSAGNLFLRMKYDDGYIAYLNGHRIAAVNAPSDAAWNSKATANHDDPAAVQFEARNISQHKDKLRKGKNVLALHGLNISRESTDMLLVAELQTNNYDYEEAIAELVDLDAFYTFWAIEGLLGFWDGYSGNRNNYFVYLNPETDKFHFMPWGADCLFQKFSQIKFDPRAPLSVKTQGLVAHTLYQLEPARERYRKTLMVIMDKHWDEEKLLAEVDRIEKLVTPHLTWGQRWSFKPGRIRAFIRNRRSEIDREIANGMPLWTSAPGSPPVIRGEWNRGRGNDGPRKSTIWTAAKNGNVAAIKQHLAKGIEVDARDKSKNTPLLIATLNGRIETVKFLISKGADINAGNSQQNTPIHCAAILGRLEVVELLAEHGVSINPVNENGQTPLDLVSSWNKGDRELVEDFADLLSTTIAEKTLQVRRPKVALFIRENGGRR